MSEERQREEMRLRTNAPLRLVRAPDVRSRQINFGGIRTTEMNSAKRRAAELNTADTSIESIENLPYFQRLMLNETAKVLPGIKRQANFLTTNFSVGLAPFLLRERERRLYFLIQNNSSINTIFLGFDFQPTALNGIVLIPGAVYEPFEVPTNDLWVSASGADTVGLLVYATEK